MGSSITKSNITYVLIYLYICAATIPNIVNSGINIVGIKVSVFDFFSLFIICILVISGNMSKMFKHFLSMNRGLFKLFIILLWYMLIYGLISFLINDINAIRITRNVFNVIFGSFIIYYLFYHCKVDNIVNKLIVLSLVLSISNIYTYSKRFESLNNYSLFRSNETILVSFLVFFLSYIYYNKISPKKYIILILSLVLIFISIIVQQERSQLIAIFITCLVIAILNLSKNDFKSNLIYIIKFLIVFCFLGLFLFYLYNNNNFFYGLINNYINNRLNLIYNNSGFQLDTSLNMRIEEVKVISKLLSNNILDLCFGKGFGAHYVAFGIDMFVVDSFWGWILLDMGVFGVILFVILFIKVLFHLLSISHNYIRMPILAFFVASVIMTLFTPNFIWRIDDGVCFSILIALILLFKLDTKSEITKPLQI